MEISVATIELLSSYFQPEPNKNIDLIWNQGLPIDCLKLLVGGPLIAVLANEAGTIEIVHTGNMVGELGILQGLP